MPDHLGPRMNAESRLATFAFADVVLSVGQMGLLMAFGPGDLRSPLQGSLYEAWPKPKTTVIRHD